MNENNKLECMFTEEPSWELAKKNTEDGLIPVAVRLFDIQAMQQQPRPGSGVPFTDNYHPSYVACMTTVFIDQKDNGFWGWAALQLDTKQAIAKLLNDRPRRWYFFSQVKIGNY